jgi:hypothetical protein
LSFRPEFEKPFDSMVELFGSIFMNIRGHKAAALGRRVAALQFNSQPKLPLKKPPLFQYLLSAAYQTYISTFGVIFTNNEFHEGSKNPTEPTQVSHRATYWANYQRTNSKSQFT